MTKPPLEADTFRRIEVIPGVGRRRRWSEEQKAAIVAETLEPGAAVSEVAQRHGVSASQVFSWRKAQAGRVPAAYPAFVPTVIEPEPSTSVRMGYGLIEVEIEGAKIRIPPDAAPRPSLPCSKAVGPTEEAAMIFGAVPPRIYIATRPVDFRKGMDGLAALVQEVLKLDPFGGTAFVFRARQSALYRDFAAKQDSWGAGALRKHLLRRGGDGEPHQGVRVLVTALRRLALEGTELENVTTGTIRLKLLKLGALVTVSVRRIKIAIASASPQPDYVLLPPGIARPPTLATQETSWRRTTTVTRGAGALGCKKPPGT